MTPDKMLPDTIVQETEEPKTHLKYNKIETQYALLVNEGKGDFVAEHSFSIEDIEKAIKQHAAKKKIQVLVIYEAELCEV